MYCPKSASGECANVSPLDANVDTQTRPATNTSASGVYGPMVTRPRTPSHDRCASSRAYKYCYSRHLKTSTTLWTVPCSSVLQISSLSFGKSGIFELIFFLIEYAHKITCCSSSLSILAISFLFAMVLFISSFYNWILLSCFGSRSERKNIAINSFILDYLRVGGSRYRRLSIIGAID